MMMQLGEPFYGLTINPSGVNSPLVTNYGGHEHVKRGSTYLTLLFLSSLPVAPEIHQ